MKRQLVLIHGYSATGLDFTPLRSALKDVGIDPIDINVGNYVSLNNEITIKDIAEDWIGPFDRRTSSMPTSRSTPSSIRRGCL